MKCLNFVINLSDPAYNRKKIYDQESISLAGTKDKLFTSEIYCKRGPFINLNLYLSQNSF